MFKNAVYMPNVNTKKWMKAAGVRAVKTFAQVFVATVGTTATVGAVDWKIVLSTSALSTILSLMTSIAGIPEVSED